METPAVNKTKEKEGIRKRLWKETSITVKMMVEPCGILTSTWSLYASSGGQMISAFYPTLSCGSAKFQHGITPAVPIMNEKSCPWFELSRGLKVSFSMETKAT